MDAGDGMLVPSLLMILILILILQWMGGLLVLLWHIACAIFTAVWIGQFVGHHIGGKRPSFFRDIQFLLIGPVYLFFDVYRMIHLSCQNRNGYRNIQVSIYGEKDILNGSEETGKEAMQIVELTQASVGRLSRMDTMQGQTMAIAADQRRQLELKK